MSVFFFGFGYSAAASAEAMRARDEGVSIAGTRRAADGAVALRALGIAGHVFDGTAPGPTLAADLVAARHVVVSIAPDGSDPVLRHHRDTLDAAGALEWLCYYSTIGVYGDRDGAWIDETAPLDDASPRLAARIAAEAAWRAYADARGLPLLVLRLAGIYGPGRSVLDKLRAGTASRIVKPGQVFNRIHVADIARVTALAAERGLAGTFNLADDLPAAPQDPVLLGAALLGVSPPPETDFATAALGPMQRAFYAGNRRVSNAAIKRALGIELIHPSYREGLAAIHAGARG